MHPFTVAFSARACRRARRKTVAALTALALAAGLTGISGALATTSLEPVPTETNADGLPVVRNDSITLTVDKGAHMYGRLFSTSNFSLVTSSLLVSCKGNNTAAGGRSDSPRSEIVVRGPGGALPTLTSPARALNLLGGDGAVLDPQPPPGNDVYLGGGPWSATQSLAGRPAGIYTVTTTIIDKVRTGSGPCISGTPVKTPSGALTNTFTTAPVAETTMFEYRPWQHKFTDLLGTGTVRMNTTPEEFQFDVSSQASPVVGGAAGAEAMQLFSLPNRLSAHISFNAGACGADPLSCLPDTAVSCDPAQGCRPRLVTIDYDDGTSHLTGLFDLETRAFAARATAGGHTRVLFSGGSDVDATIQGLLDRLNEMAGGLGLDLPALLATSVNLNVARPDGTTDVIQISFLRMIEIFNVPDGPATGLALTGPLSVGAGVITHFGEWIRTPAPINPALRDANGDHSGYGYTVTEATALPTVPSLGAPLNVLVPPGKVKHVTGRIPTGSGGHVVAVGVDTDPDATTGLPFHLPLASAPGLVPDTGLDFVGTTVFVVSAEVCNPALGGCLGGAAMLGTGVATFGTSPLPVNFGSLPLVWGDDLGLGNVVAPVDGTVADVTGSVLTTPAVTELLAMVPLADLIGGQVPGDLPPGVPPPDGLPPGALPLANLLSMF